MVHRDAQLANVRLKQNTAVAYAAGSLRHLRRARANHVQTFPALRGHFDCAPVEGPDEVTAAQYFVARHHQVTSSRAAF